MNILSRLSCTIGSIIFLVASIQNEAKSQSFDEAFQEICVQNGLVGSSLVTLCGDDIQIYNFGQSHISPDIEVTDETKYRIASISKMVTALGCMLLVDDGVLDLDEDVSTYLGWNLKNPSFPDTPITARLLLSHLSSIQDGTGYSNFINSTFGQWPPAPLHQLLLTDGIDFSQDMFTGKVPGSYFQYSNVNFVILGTIIEAISEKRFDIFLKERLFEPLGIDGGFNLYELPDYSNLATLYRNDIVQQDNYVGQAPVSPNFDEYIVGSSAQFFGPQGSLRISLSELIRILQLVKDDGTYNQESIISPSIIQEMKTEVWTYNGQNGNDYYGLFQQWGLGIHHTTNSIGEDIVFQDYKMSGHAGEAYGLISDLYFSQEIPFGFVWCTNGYHSGYGYSFADNSSFYSVESEIFQLMEEELIASCQTSSIEEEANFLDLHYEIQGSFLVVETKVDVDKLSIIDISGKTIYTSTMKKSQYKVDIKNAPTIIIAIVEVDGEQYPHKIHLQD